VQVRAVELKMCGMNLDDRFGMAEIYILYDNRVECIGRSLSVRDIVLIRSYYKIHDTFRFRSIRIMRTSI
jgi:hypothetical protein